MASASPIITADKKNDSQYQQRHEINQALSSSPINISLLKQLSRKNDGFISNTLRSRVWPSILGVNPYHIPDYKRYVRVHRDAAQLRCDIDRSFWSLDCAKLWGKKRLARKRAALSDIITAVLVRNPNYYYFQGFHDIVSVLMLVFHDDSMVFGVLEAMCEQYFSDYMRKDFSVLSRVMKLIMSIIKFADAALYEHLEASGTEPYFATSWLITWLSHDIRNIHDIARVFDVFLCSPPEYCLYFCASLVILHKKQLLSIECEFSSIHNYLSRIMRLPTPDRPLDVDDPPPPDDDREDTLQDQDHASDRTGVRRSVTKNTSSSGGNEKSNKTSQQTSQRTASISAPGSKHVPTYPFDFAEAVALTDALFDQLPPRELFRLADPELKRRIVETKTIMFNEPQRQSAVSAGSIASSAAGVSSSSRNFIPDYILRASQRIVLRVQKQSGLTRVAGWFTVFLGQTIGAESNDTSVNEDQSVDRNKVTPAEDSLSGGGNSKQGTTRVIVLAITGGVLSFTVWAVQIFLLKKNK